MYMLRSSGPLTEKKLRANDVATALASSVLPVPGGPYSSTPVDSHLSHDIDLRAGQHLPDRFLMQLANSSGCWRCSWMVTRISRLTDWGPPTSSHDTLGTYFLRRQRFPCGLQVVVVVVVWEWG